MTQIDVYTEEKFEDEEDLRERTRSIFRDSEGESEFELTFSIIRDATMRQEILKPSVMDVLRSLGSLMSRETTL